jgi:hypothetical protein
MVSVRLGTRPASPTRHARGLSDKAAWKAQPGDGRGKRAGYGYAGSDRLRRRREQQAPSFLPQCSDFAAPFTTNTQSRTRDARNLIWNDAIIDAIPAQLIDAGATEIFYDAAIA